MPKGLRFLQGALQSDLRPQQRRCVSGSKLAAAVWSRRLLALRSEMRHGGDGDAHDDDNLLLKVMIIMMFMLSTMSFLSC